MQEMSRWRHFLPRRIRAAGSPEKVALLRFLAYAAVGPLERTTLIGAPLSTPDRPTRVRWLIFGLACATSWLLYLHRYTWGVIKPRIKEAYPDLSGSQLGSLDSVLMAAYSLGQVPGGRAGDVLGARAVLAVMILVWSVMVACLGWSHGYWPWAACLAVFGLAQAGAYPVLSRVTRSWFPLAIRTGVQGAVASLSGRAGGACASLIVATLLMGCLGLHWRTSVVVLAGLGIGFALAFWLLFRNDPAEHPWANAAEVQLVSEGEVPSAPDSRPMLRGDRASLFNFGMLLVTAFAGTFVDALYVFWIPTFLEQGKGLTRQEMGVFASLPMLGGALGGLCGGFLNDLLIRRTGRRRLARSSVAGTGKLFAALLIALSVAVPDGRLVALVLLAGKFFNDWAQPTIWGTVTDISGRAAGTVFGVVNTTGTLAALLASPIIGHVSEHQGWDVVFFGLAGMYVVAATAWLFIDCTIPLVVESKPAVEPDNSPAAT